MLDGPQLGEDARCDLAAVEVLAAVAVAVHGKEHLRLDLRETVDHAARAPYSGAALDQIAPSEAVARKATIASGMFGM